jgi:hypothetical protein
LYAANKTIAVSDEHGDENIITVREAHHLKTVFKVQE